MVDEKKEKQQRCLRVFNSYFPSYNREDGCIKAIKENLERIKKISNLEEKGRKSHFYWTKHRDDEIHASSRYSSGNLNELGISRLDTIEKYQKLIKELWELGIETVKQLNNKSRERERERERERGERERERANLPLKEQNPLKSNLNHLKPNQNKKLSPVLLVPLKSPPPITTINPNPKINSVLMNA